MTIFSTAAELLATGPQSLTDLTAHVIAAGATRARNPEATVRQALGYRAVQLPDGRWANPVRLLEGRVLTMRSGTGRSAHDLALFHQAIRWSPLRLADGGTLKTTSWSARLTGLPTWAEEQSGLLFSLSLRQGVVHVERVEVEAPDLAETGRDLEARVGRLTGVRWDKSATALSDDLSHRLWGLLEADPLLLTQTSLPFTECFAQLSAAVHDEAPWDDPMTPWRPTLELPSHVRELANEQADRAGEPVEQWLSDLVERTLQSAEDAPRAQLYSINGARR